MAALPYRNVRDIYDTLHKAGVVTQNLPDWSTEMNALTNSDVYSSGLNDNFVKHASVGLDRLLESTGLPDLTASFGEGVGSMVGAPEVGRRIGHDIPRMGVNFAPMFLGPAGLPAVAALSGAQTYTETGSPAAGVLAGLTNVAMPGVAGKAEQMVLKRLGGQLLEGPIASKLTAAGLPDVTSGVSRLSHYLPKTIGQGVTAELAGQGAAALFGEASGFGQDLLAGNDLHNPFSVETLLNLTLGQAPFAGIYLTKGGRAKFGGEATRQMAREQSAAIAKTQEAIDASEASRKARENDPLGSIPVVGESPLPVNPKAIAENSSLLAKLRGEKAALAKEATPESMEEWNKRSADEQRIVDEQNAVTKGVGTLGGEALTPEADRFNVVGEVHYERPGYRIIRAADDPANADLGVKPGELISYSTKFEPSPTANPLNNGQVFSVPSRFHTRDVVDNRAVELAKAKETHDAANPGLPFNEAEFDIENFRSQRAKLQQVKAKLDAVTNEDDFRAVLVDFNNALLEAGFPEMDDAAIKRRMEYIGAKTADEAVRSKLSSLDRRIEAKQKKIEEDRVAATNLRAELLSPREQALAGDLVETDSVALANDLHRVISESTMDSNQLDRNLLEWDRNGRKGGVQGLVDKLSNAKKSGKGRKKADNAVPSVKKVEGSEPTPETQPLKDIRADIADALITKVMTDEPSLGDTASAWLDWVESGTKELPKGLKDDPNVAEWNDQLRQYLSVRIDKNSISRSVDEVAGQEDVSPFKPNEQEAAQLREWGLEQGGAGLANRLSKSIYPEVAALGQSLLQFPEALKRVTAEVWNLAGGSFAFVGKDGRAGVVLDASLLHDTDFMEWQAAHELLHGLTKAELANPSNPELVTQLDSLRNEMIGRLSTKGGEASDKAAYDRAVANNWLTRYNRGEASPAELHANPKTRRILYGLLNNDELISQGFTSEDMRNWLQSQKVGPQSLWHKFSGWVKSLVGIGEKMDDSAFQRLLGHTSQLLSQGEFVASSRNYFERFFENKGAKPERVTELTNKAIGLLLDSKRTPETMLDGVFAKTDAGSQELQLAQRDAIRLFQSKDDNTLVATSILDELGHKPDVAGLDEFALAASRGDHLDSELALEMMPEEASKYVFAKLTDAKDVLDGVKGAVAKANEGTLNLADVQGLRNAVGDANKRVTKLLKLEAAHLQAKRDIQGMATINPPGFIMKTMDMAKSGEVSRSIDDIKAMVDPDAPKQEFLSWIERKLALPYQIARQDARAAELVAKMEQQSANVHKMTSESLKVMATDDVADTLAGLQKFGVSIDPGQIGGNLTEEALKRTLKVVQQPKLTRAAKEWIFENQKRNPGKEVVLPSNDPAVQKILKDLSPEERTQVNEMMQKVVVSKTTHDAQIVEKMKQISSTAASKVLGRVGREFGLSLNPNDRLTLASTLLEASLVDFNDPQQAAQANASIMQVSQRVPLEAFNELLKFTNVEAEKIKTIRDNMAERPGWVSGQDFGRYRVVWLDKAQKVHRWSGNDAKEAEAVAKKASKVVDFKDNGANYDDEIHYPSMTPELISRIRELEESSWDIQQLGAEEKAQLRQTASIATQIEREAGAQGVSGVVSPNRRLSRGAEDLPWLENHFSWISSSANAWTRRLLKAQYETHMSEPEVQASEQYRTWAKEYFEGYMRQDPEVATKLKKFTSIWFLGGNLASAIANPIGNGMRMVSELTALSGKPLNSYSRFLKAANEVAGNFRSNKPWATPEHDQLIKDAIHERKLSPTLYDDNAAAQEAVSTRYKQAIEGQKPQTLGQRLGTLAGSFTTAAMWPFRMGEIWNAKVALLSSFDLYREQGLGYQEAKAKAFEFSGAVNDSGGRANRPVGPFSARGDVPRSAAMLSTSMQSFVLGSTFQLVRYLKQGLYRPAGLTPHETYSARAAAIQMLAMQFAAAGVLGLPFVSGALALLDKSFPELELNRKLREASSKFFQSDKEGGSVLGDIAMTGIPSMFGWDIQSRLSMGNTVPGVSEVNGFQPETILGPPLSLVSQFVRGGQRLLTGQGRVQDWTPPAVKKLVELGSSGGDSVNDYKGRPVLNDLTPGEKIGITLGFNPKRLSDFNAASRMADTAQKVAGQKETHWRQAQAEQVAKGNFGTVRQELLSRSQGDKSFDPVEAVRQIARATEELSFPRDLRREGSQSTSGTRSALLSAFQMDPSQPSELARLQLRKQVEQRLGLQGGNDQNEIRLAQLMDGLRAKQPNATRAELRRSAEAALKTQRPRTLGLSQENQ